MNILKKYKAFIVVILSLLLLVGLSYFAYLRISENALEKAAEKKQKEESGRENAAYIVQRAMQMQKNTESCKLLRAKDVNSCYLDVANLNNDKKICELIDKKTVRDACFENFAYKEAVSSKNIRNCYVIASSSRDGCLYDYFKHFSDTKECSVLDDVDRQKCIDSVNSAQAYKSKDDGLCDLVIDGSAREDCKRIIKNNPLDSDKDGLSDSDERSYGTNPLNLDTDSDGASDYDEIFKYKTSPLKADIENKSDNDGV